MQSTRSKWKNQFQKLSNSSKFHEAVRLILTTDPFFKKLTCFQEVPVSALVPSYRSNQQCVDWYIDELGTVLELHGKQHYEMANFGNIAYEKAKKDFHNIQYRDNSKKQALLEEGIEYREISYKLKSKLNAELLKQIIFYGE